MKSEIEELKKNQNTKQYNNNNNSNNTINNTININNME